MSFESFEEMSKKVEKEMREDKRTIWSIARNEGSLMATDYWCIRYINIPIKLRYIFMPSILKWWGNTKLGRWLTNHRRSTIK